jgi:Domain of unknown function (DUF4129)
VNGSRRLLLSGVALTALLALVALASRAHRPGGGTGGGGGHLPLLLGEYIGVMALVLMLVTVVLAGWGLAGDRHRRLLEKQTNWRRTLAGLAILAILALIAFRASDNLHLNTNPRRPGVTGVGKPLKALQKEQAKKGTQGSWLTALVLGSILVGVAVAVGVAARHRRLHGEELDEEEALARALDEVLADSLDDLRAERDPRKAVIEVYARMEKTFAAYRVPRDPAETPLEYVSRVLDSLSVSAGAVRRLTLLFERAKFSTHDVDTGMKDTAIETLAGVRAELAFGQEEAA